MEVSDEVHALVNLTPSDKTSAQQTGGCVQPQSQTDYFGERKKYLAPAGIQSQITCWPSSGLQQRLSLYSQCKYQCAFKTEISLFYIWL
jgi:hypothetical protein